MNNELPRNRDFPRVLTLLRKERGLSQKKVAADLGIAQALLSHYENGKRECGLNFLVQAADYYGVSVDYLLGRTGSSTGTVVSEQELPESSVNEKYTGSIAGSAVFFRKKLLTNALEVVFSLLAKTKNTELSKHVSDYLTTAVYRSYRMVYSAGGKNDERSFAVPAEHAAALSAARMQLDGIKAADAAKGGSEDEKITASRLEAEFPKQSAALFSIVSSTEKSIGKLE